MLFGGAQRALQPDHDQVADQVGMDVFGPPSHELLLESSHAVADGRFDLSLRVHSALRQPGPVRGHVEALYPSGLIHQRRPAERPMGARFNVRRTRWAISES